MTLRGIKPLAISSLILLCLSSPGWAQGVVAGSFDFSANVGFSSLTGVDGSKHPQFGASAGANLSKRVELGLDYEYKVLGSVTLSGATGAEDLQLIGVSVRANLSRSKRAVPFVVVGGGLADLHNFATLQKTLSGVNYQATEDYTQGGSYFTMGGGVSLYVRPRHSWGVRPEFFYQRQHFSPASVNQGYGVSAFSESDVQGLVSLFFQFGGD